MKFYRSLSIMLLLSSALTYGQDEATVVDNKDAPATVSSSAAKTVEVENQNIPKRTKKGTQGKQSRADKKKKTVSSKAVKVTSDKPDEATIVDDKDVPALVGNGTAIQEEKGIEAVHQVESSVAGNDTLLVSQREQVMETVVIEQSEERVISEQPVTQEPQVVVEQEITANPAPEAQEEIVVTSTVDVVEVFNATEPVDQDSVEPAVQPEVTQQVLEEVADLEKSYEDFKKVLIQELDAKVEDVIKRYPELKAYFDKPDTRIDYVFFSGVKIDEATEEETEAVYIEQ